MCATPNASTARAAAKSSRPEGVRAVVLTAASCRNRSAEGSHGKIGTCPVAALRDNSRCGTRTCPESPPHGREAMPQWTLFEQDFRVIDETLGELIERTNAVSVHLVDRSGQLITSSGRVGDLDPTGFASLIAAEFTANAELAQMLGDQGVDAVVSEGKTRSVYSCLLADRVIMATVFDRRRSLGLVR